MKVPYKATPEQWQRVISWKAEGSYCDSCLLELRDRLAAAEQRIQALEGNSSAGLTRSNHLAKPDSSVIAVTRRCLQEPSANHIAECGGPCEQGFWNCDCGLLYELNPDLRPHSPAPAGGLVERVCDAIGTADKPARAAILMVADWLEQYNAAASGWADIIRQEVNDHG